MAPALPNFARLSTSAPKSPFAHWRTGSGRDSESEESARVVEVVDDADRLLVLLKRGQRARELRALLLEDQRRAQVDEVYGLLRREHLLVHVQTFVPGMTCAEVVEG